MVFQTQISSNCEWITKLIKLTSLFIMYNMDIWCKVSPCFYKTLMVWVSTIINHKKKPEPQVFKAGKLINNILILKRFSRKYSLLWLFRLHVVLYKDWFNILDDFHILIFDLFHFFRCIFIADTEAVLLLRGRTRFGPGRSARGSQERINNGSKES